MKELRNKVVVITGAGSGIGRALAVAFSKEGARLALNEFNPVTLNETVDLIGKGTEVFPVSFDVADKDAMFSFAKSVKERFGQIDVMINNAGVSIGEYPLHQIDLDMFERVMDVNFYGMLYGSRAFIPYLIEQPESSLFNVSSVFGLTGIIHSSAYCASKFAVYGLNQSLIQEHKNSSLTIHSVHPGGIKTNIARNAVDYNEAHEAFHQQFLKLSPEYAATVIISGIKKKRKRILIGAEAFLLDFVVRLFPVWGGSIVNGIIQKKVEALKRK
ncbi:MAG: SDR family oxidoreductase [Cyclobacteriaceae bacterium]|nr:SDR family oxidoreductase [Cyclobacteriaceae bacterium]